MERYAIPILSRRRDGGGGGVGITSADQAGTVDQQWPRIFDVVISRDVVDQRKRERERATKPQEFKVIKSSSWMQGLSLPPRDGHVPCLHCLPWRCGGDTFRYDTLTAASITSE